MSVTFIGGGSGSPVSASNFTTAQLSALSPSASRALAFAYCSDCINSGGQSAGSVGALAIWSDQAQVWMTFNDHVPITTDFMQWAVWMHLRNRTPHIVNSFASHFSVMQPLSGLLSTGTSGVAGNFNASIIGGMDSLGYRQALSSGAGVGSVYARFSRLNQTSGNASFSAALRRSVALVGTIDTFATSVSASDNVAYRFGIGTEETGASPATTWPNTFCGFVFDDTNAWTTPGASTALRAVVRVAGTDIYAPASIGITGALNSTVTANALCVATVEPTGLTTARFRVAYQIADGSFVTAYNDILSLGATPPVADLSLQPHFAANKTLGTTARTMSFPRASASFITTAGSISIPYRANFPIP